jgi:hypothetical protein
MFILNGHSFSYLLVEIILRTSLLYLFQMIYLLNLEEQVNQKKTYKMTNNDLQNIHIKLKIE